MARVYDDFEQGSQFGGESAVAAAEEVPSHAGSIASSHARGRGRPAGAPNKATRICTLPTCGKNIPLTKKVCMCASLLLRADTLLLHADTVYTFG
jgi:hypothetical protein